MLSILLGLTEVVGTVSLCNALEHFIVRLVKTSRNIPKWTYFLVGAIIGSVSLIFLKHSIVDNILGKICVLIFSPIISGYLGQKIADLRSMTELSKKEHFNLAFYFTLGFAVVRFVFAY